MSGFDPGPGWREMPRGTYAERDDDPTLVLMVKGESSRRWVREAPVPPLPTEPYTVIRVTWRSKVKSAAVLLLSGTEDKWSGMGYSYDSPHLAADITSFEVLAEPRAVTAEALMLRLETLREGDGENWREQILHEFGVES